MPVVIAVSGWRMHRDTDFIRRNLAFQADHLVRLGFELFFRVGDNKGKNGAPGVDRIAQDWLRETYPTSYQVYEANWDALGNYAGPDRNKNMLTGTRDPHGIASLLMAFPEPGVYRYRDSGTWRCCKEAFRLGVRVEVPAYRLEESERQGKNL